MLIQENQVHQFVEPVHGLERQVFEGSHHLLTLEQNLDHLDVQDYPIHLGVGPKKEWRQLRFLASVPWHPLERPSTPAGDPDDRPFLQVLLLLQRD